ncbi:hypothetical protein [uncultured Cohaesibacter sp.]|uniref:hypothetical protein n=1 Tax=uncultured Cohaesibacter sp. TaxID=1002546 RepID=UPI0029C935AE|nr:hypothetical protein [uncultured Cohaesibacter sp.]
MTAAAKVEKTHGYFRLANATGKRKKRWQISFTLICAARKVVKNHRRKGMDENGSGISLGL